MATILTAGNATNGLSLIPDNTGILQVKTGTGSGTTALTLDASQNTTIAGNLTLTGNASGILKSGTAVASTSGTSIDFTGIPSTTKRITVMLAGLSTNGTSILQLQLGSTSIQTSGYLGANGAQTTGVGTGNATTGVTFGQANAAASIRHGKFEICLLTGNTWVITGINSLSDTALINYSGFSVTLAGTLDRVRITTVNGTDTFDAGSINILYE